MVVGAIFIALYAFWDSIASGVNTAASSATGGVTGEVSTSGFYYLDAQGRYNPCNLRNEYTVGGRTYDCEYYNAGISDQLVGTVSTFLTGFNVFWIGVGAVYVIFFLGYVIGGAVLVNKKKKPVNNTVYPQGAPQKV